MEKQKNIPVLRFSEFSGAWQKSKIVEVSDKVNSGKTPLGGESVYSESGVLFIRSQNITDNKLFLENSTFIPEEINDTMTNSIVKPNDILLNITGASLGRSCVVPDTFKRGNVNQHVCIIRINKYNNPRFIQPIFASEKGQNLFKSLQTGSGREGLNFQSIKEISLYFPSLPEQTKIANFLSVIDERFNQLKKKKALLEQYKKGVMQKIFNQEIRFKDDYGNEFTEWEEKRLGEITEITIGEFVIRTKQNPNAKYPVFNGGKTYTGFYNEFNNEGNKIIISARGANAGFVNFSIGRFWAGNSCYSVSIVEKTKYNTAYFYFYIKMYENNFIQNQQAANIPSVSKKDAENFLIQVPSFPEQTKIANFLLAINENIEMCSNQIAKTEQYKKGLLQKMFC